jgi:hypothetical protein
MESERNGFGSGLYRCRRAIWDGIRQRVASVGFGVCLFGFWRNRSEDYGCGLLHGFQTFAQEIGVSVP